MARRHAQEHREYPESGLQKVEQETRPKNHPMGNIKKPTEKLSDTFSLPEKLKKRPTTEDSE
ncbi:hypothetical protein KA013_01935 [Patescibacteria group bacterium]|nr:hypothetical protein [Patescibacteria group bacterium]